MGFCGNSHRIPVRMGWEWELKILSHGNPGIKESFTAHYGLELITSHFSIFRISMESDVVAIVRDGGSLKRKLCRVSRVSVVYSTWYPLGSKGRPL